MNLARQNHVIMEILGYVWTETPSQCYWQFPADRSRDCFLGHYNFAQSLDAIHMAEDSLIKGIDRAGWQIEPGNAQRYELILMDELPIGAIDAIWHAPACYRARAFVRCWDRWEPGEDDTIKLIEPELRPSQEFSKFYSALLCGMWDYTSPAKPI